MSEISLWKEQYNIGNEEIDEQHYQLFCKIERLLSISLSDNFAEKKKECFLLIDFLIDYTHFHFETEERIQKEMNYVGYEQHLWIHREFIETILEYKETLEKHFSLHTLKSFLGTLLTWLTLHVCGCDRKIMDNIPLDDQNELADAAGNIDLVITQFFENYYRLGVTDAKTCLYKGFVDGEVVIRWVVKGKSKYVLLYGLSEQIARELYTLISTLQIGNIEKLDGMESSALMEVTDILTSRIIAVLSDDKITDFQYENAIFIKEYTDETYNLRDGIIITVETEYGNMEVLYCKIE